ncbi:putative capsid protein [Odonata-associated circular virus 5]|uniref:Putative capsid protein n=1 Tax=Odonata-associated circular virus 5 TaxID=1592125 RepID=A0A0B4UI30_9VIRU|nr:putative capsid protein [Odonata-associated circular virus 5]AJD07510.1 putative capsid protein [Odonata-associated circular virus 5]
MTTQFAQASYQEIIDLNTVTDKVSVLGIHTPVTDTPYTFLKPFFDAFQKYHYDGCSLTMVPAARLPADPSQVSYESGEQPIDPRDLLNPILWHGAHGESLGAVLNQFYDASGSTSDIGREFFDSGEVSRASLTQVGNDALYESLYYRALTDNSWRKAHPQTGLRVKGLHPLVYSVGTDAQYLNNPTGTTTPQVPRSANSPLPPSDAGPMTSVGAAGTMGKGTSSPYGLQSLNPQGLQDTSDSGDLTYVRSLPTPRTSQFFTERLHGLGWLDTRVRISSTSGFQAEVSGNQTLDRMAVENLYEQVEDSQTINYLPRLFMGVCLLPPSYKAKQYYRLVINHRFSFRKFRGLSMDGGLRGRYGPARAPSYRNLM